MRDVCEIAVCISKAQCRSGGLQYDAERNFIQPLVEFHPQSFRPHTPRNLHAKYEVERIPADPLRYITQGLWIQTRHDSFVDLPIENAVLFRNRGEEIIANIDRRNGVIRIVIGDDVSDNLYRIQTEENIVQIPLTHEREEDPKVITLRYDCPLKFAVAAYMIIFNPAARYLIVPDYDIVVPNVESVNVIKAEIALAYGKFA